MIRLSFQGIHHRHACPNTEYPYRLRQGEIVEFPNRYELAQVKGKFGGCFMD